MSCLLISLFLIFLTRSFGQQYNATWESLDTRPLPGWFDQQKFGIFIHWGVFAVPSWSVVGQYAEWYWYQLNINGSATQQFHKETYGADFPYQQFASSFTAEMWDAQEWVDLFKKAGAKYVVPTTKHHEGYTMWPSAQSWNWNAKDIGPGRDIIGELATELRRQGLYVGLYMSLFEWYHPLYLSANPQDYVNEICIPQLHDIVNTYLPDIIWGDGDDLRDSDFWQTKEFLAWVYNDSPVKDKVVVNDRWGQDCQGQHGGFFTPEYSSEVFLDHKWEENSGIDIHSYGYNRNTLSEQYFSAYQLITLLIRTVANGGNLLLNIGPTWDGRVPNIMRERLLQMGAWLDVNGEAIYNTTLWRVQQETYMESPTQFYTKTNFDNVLGSVSPGSSSSSITYYGKTAFSQSCQSTCARDSTCLSFTWYDSNQGSYSNMCYGRKDEFWDPAYSTGHISARKVHYTTSYTFNATTKTIFGIIDFFPTNDLLIFPSPVPQTNTTSVIEFIGYGEVPWSYDPSTGVIVKLDSVSVTELPGLYAWAFKFINFN